jgi:hypothetical protein
VIKELKTQVKNKELEGSEKERKGIVAIYHSLPFLLK